MSHRTQSRSAVAPAPQRGLDEEVDPWMRSPSDFAFHWDDCQRCSRQPHPRSPFPVPRSPFPSVFGKIDRAMKDRCLGDRSETVASGMPEGVIGGGDRGVMSVPVVLPGGDRPVLIRGQVDVLVDFDDGPVGVGDFKTTLPKADHLATYSRHLHAYAWALEHPAGGPAAPVSAL